MAAPQERRFSEIKKLKHQNDRALQFCEAPFAKLNAAAHQEHKSLVFILVYLVHFKLGWSRSSMGGKEYLAGVKSPTQSLHKGDHCNCVPQANVRCPASRATERDRA